MKKITAAVLATVLLAGAASANTCTGFFGSLGVTTGAGTSQSNITRANNTAGDTQFKTDSGKTMVGAKVEFGYAMTFSGNLWGAISAYAGINSLKYTIYDDFMSANTGQILRFTLRNKYTYGGEIKFGYHMTKDTVAFISVAGEAGKYELSWADAGTTGTRRFPPAQKTSKTKFYIKPGVGFRTMVAKNIFVEAKYAMGFPQKISFVTPADTASQGLQLDNRNVSTKIRTHEFTLAVGYKF